MAVLTVGPNQQFATVNAAVAASKDGDTLYVQAGVYHNDFSVIKTKISIIGVGGMAHFTSDKPASNGKAILVTNTDILLDHLEFSGAKVSDGNGAGIKYQGGNLTVANSYFHQNQNGLLASGVANGTVTIDRSEFAANGTGDGMTHNLYANAIASLTVSNSYFHDAILGHEIKSRAQKTTLLNNRITDGNATASYSVDLPLGGDAIIRNNFIQQGPKSANPKIISFSTEQTKPQWANSHLLVEGNTIVNQLGLNSVQAVANRGSGMADLVGNKFYGLTAAQIASGPNKQSGNSWLSTLPGMDTSHPWAQSPWDKLISGKAGNDTLSGTAGRDLIAGGAGKDSFVIRLGGGSDTIADFQSAAGEVVRLEGYTLSDFAAVKAKLSQSGADALLSLGNGDILTLKSVPIATLSAANFAFGTAATPAAAAPAAPATGFTLPVSGPQTQSIIGNANNNVLNGTAANDYIDGRSGTDTMSGGPGDDTFVVNRPSDVVIENNAAGIDTVIASASSYVLAANVENLTLSGSGPHQASGNGLDNLITGSSTGNDTIDAKDGNDIIKPGQGANILTGGAGNDMFVFSAPGAGNVITDFHPGEDLFDLSLLLQSYTGTDPIADGVLSIASDGTGGTLISADPAHTGTMQAVADLSGITPAMLQLGVDIIW